MRYPVLAFVVLGAIVTTAGCAVSVSRTAHAFEERAERRGALAEHRRQQIARLHAYAEQGIFPRNLAATGGAVPGVAYHEAADTRSFAAARDFLADAFAAKEATRL